MRYYFLLSLFYNVNHNSRDLLLVKDWSVDGKQFGEKVFVFNGDYQQILPIIPKEKLQHILGALLLKSNLWKDWKVFPFF